MYIQFQENKQNKKCLFPSLANTLLVADLPRVQKELSNFNKQLLFAQPNIQKKIKDLKFIPKGKLLICKVLMLKSQQDQNFPYFDATKSSKEILETQALDPNNYGKNAAIYRSKSQNSNHKQWFIMNKNLVIPEYLVEFDYIFNQSQDSKLCFLGNQIIEREDQKDFTQYNQNNNEMDLLYNNLVDQVLQSGEKDLKTIRNIDLKAIDLIQCNSQDIIQTLLNLFQFCNIGKIYETQFKNQIYTSLQSSSVETIQTLMIENQKIQKLDRNIFEYMKQLQQLNISYNLIGSLEPLSCLINLKCLNACQNEIKDIQPVSLLKMLQYLNLSQNNISDFLPIQNLDQLQILNIGFNIIQNSSQIKFLKQNSKLKELIIWNNKFTDHQNIILKIKDNIPHLEKIDMQNCLQF